MTTAMTVIRQVFSDLTDDEIAALLKEADLRDYPSGCVLCVEGEIEHTFYFVLDGTVDITIRMLDGTPRKVSERGAGGYFGEMALLEQKPRSATVTTVAPTRTLEISEETFNRLLRRNPDAAITMLRFLTSALRATDRASISDLSRQNAELARAYADLKAAQAQLVLRERLQRELEIAAEVQQSMLPEVFPDVPGWEFAGHNSPAREIGGDLYDVIELDDEHLGLLIADVSDKSVHAALFMAVTRTLFMAEATRSLSAHDTTLRVHEGLLKVSSKDDMFVTVFYGVLHHATGTLRYVRAGQDYPLLKRASAPDTVLELQADGRFLGMIEDIYLEEREITLQPGDTLVMYSDGVSDMMSSAGQHYSVDRLVEQVCRRPNLPAQMLCDAIVADLGDHRGDMDPYDDATLLICRRSP